MTNIMFIIILVFSQLKEVLQKQATVEAFTEWIDATLTQKVIKVCVEKLNSKLLI